MNPNFPFAQFTSSAVSDGQTLAHATLLALSDIRGIGLGRLHQYKSRIPDIKNTGEAYQLYREMQSKFPKSIPEMDFKDFSHKIQVAEKELEAQEKLGAHLVSFESSLHRKLFANVQIPPLYFFYWGSREALLNHGISLVTATEVNEFSKEKAAKLAGYISERNWNSIFSLDANPLIDYEFISQNAKKCKAGTACLLVQKAPLAESLKDERLKSAIREGHGCLIGLSMLGGGEKQMTWFNAMQLQIALSKGTFAFGYAAEDTPTSQKHQDVYYNLIRKYGKQILCYKCDPRQRLDAKYGDLVSGDELLQDAKLLEEGRISSLYLARDIDAFLDKCLEAEGAMNATLLRNIG